jgi:Holliday junction resolvase|tara:strand:- start:411 stop:737 length:327 start_codon:yes stop_codon:yes gene_type:complete
MSGKAPKQKGNRIERECVNLAKGYGFESRRAWGSDGRSLGWHEEVDMTIDIPKIKKLFKFQVKGRKSIADYLKPCEEVYGQILKEDRKEPLVTIRYKDLLELLKSLTG